MLSAYAENLRRIGVALAIRQIDPASYQSRLKDFDYDVVMARHTLSATPLDNLPQFFGSLAADTPGTFNYAGVKEPAIDALLARLPSVKSRRELIVITRAIDRILRWRHYSIPNWYNSSHRVAHWDLFGRPPTKPDYDFAPETTWWFDRERATAIGMAG